MLKATSQTQGNKSPVASICCFQLNCCFRVFASTNCWCWRTPGCSGRRCDNLAHSLWWRAPWSGATAKGL